MRYSGPVSVTLTPNKSEISAVKRDNRFGGCCYIIPYLYEAALRRMVRLKHREIWRDRNQKLMAVLLSNSDNDITMYFFVDKLACDFARAVFTEKGILASPDELK
jgi:hypothetical protein